MKIKLTVRERKNLKTLISNPQLGGGVSLAEIEDGLELLSALDCNCKDDDKLTELELKDSQVIKLHQKATAFTGWPIAQWVKDMKDRLDEYKKKAKS